MTETVYRITKRVKGSNDPWTQDNSSGRRTGSPYTNLGTAKGEATRRSHNNWRYEYRVESAVLSWEVVNG